MLREFDIKKVIYGPHMSPSSVGFHIPTPQERKDTVDLLNSLGIVTVSWSNNSIDGISLQTCLHMPFTGYFDNTDGHYETANGNYRLQTSELTSGAVRFGRRIFYNATNTYDPTIVTTGTQMNAGIGLPIRLYADTPILPDETWTLETPGISGGVYYKGDLLTISDGVTAITLKDRNVGATSRREYGENLSSSKCGNLFQWGNTYPFTRNTNGASSGGATNIVQGPIAVTDSQFNSNGIFYTQTGSSPNSASTNLYTGGTNIRYLFGPQTIFSGSLIQSNVKKIMLGQNLVWPEQTYDGMRFKNNGNTIESVTLTKTGNPSFTPTLTYQYSDLEIYPYTIGQSISIAPGQKVYINSTNTSAVTSARLSNSSSAYYKFVTSGPLECGGDITCLIKKYGGVTSIGSYCFYKLFENTYITTAPTLPFSSYTSTYMCSYMFAGCQQLTVPPSLHMTAASSTQCASYMFYNCSNLEKIPLVYKVTTSSIVRENYYNYMFAGCSKIRMSTSNVSPYTNAYPINTGTSSSRYSGQYMFQGTGGTFTGNGYGTLYTSNEVIP